MELALQLKVGRYRDPPWGWKCIILYDTETPKFRIVARLHPDSNWSGKHSLSPAALPRLGVVKDRFLPVPGNELTTFS